MYSVLCLTDKKNGKLYDVLEVVKGDYEIALNRQKSYKEIYDNDLYNIELFMGVQLKEKTLSELI